MRYQISKPVAQVSVTALPNSPRPTVAHPSRYLHAAFTHSEKVFVAPSETSIFGNGRKLRMLSYQNRDRHRRNHRPTPWFLSRLGALTLMPSMISWPVSEVLWHFCVMRYWGGDAAVVLRSTFRMIGYQLCRVYFEHGGSTLNKIQ